MAPSPGVGWWSLLLPLLHYPASRQVFAAINRFERRALTENLNAQWRVGAHLRHDCPTACSPLPSATLRRPCRRLFAAQRATWGQGPPRRSIRWSGWPHRGERVGEAFYPGPASERERSPPPAARPATVHCPVIGCPSSCQTIAPGWSSDGPTSMTTQPATCRATSLPATSLPITLVCARSAGCWSPSATMELTRAVALQLGQVHALGRRGRVVSCLCCPSHAFRR